MVFRIFILQGKNAFIAVRRYFLYLALAALFGFDLGSAVAGEESSSVITEEEQVEAPRGMLSLVEEAPALVQQTLRYRKFFGDPNTVDGGLLDRSYATGDWGGLRTDLADVGIYPSISMTQFFGGNLSGGRNTEFRNNGSLDYSLWLDTGKANLWPGGALFLHGETSWGSSINGDVGSIIPSNFDAVMPDPDSPATSLSEFYLIQGLSDQLTVAAGKMDLATWADGNLFANNWRYQFNMASLVNNPLLSAMVPYTTYANWWAYSFNEKSTLVYTVNTVDSNATEAGFDTIFNGNMTHSLLWILEPEINGKPGLYHFLAGYSSVDPISFAVDPHHALAQVLGIATPEREDGNYGFVASGSQYLWTSETKSPDSERPLGGGIFFRYGATPKDRNVFNQFVSVGLGGFGGPADRIHDNWGIGWAAAHVSPDLRNAASLLFSGDEWEHGVEAFYNFGITRSTHLSLHAQCIDSALSDVDNAFALGARLQIDF